MRSSHWERITLSTHLSIPVLAKVINSIDYIVLEVREVLHEFLEVRGGISLQSWFRGA